MRKIIFFVLVAGFCWSSCRKGNPSWETGLVFPIAHAEMTIDNIIPDSLTTTNSDGSVRLIYSTRFLGMNTDTIFNIPDTTIYSEYHLPLGNITFNPGDFLPTGPASQSSFAVSNGQLVYGILNAGRIDMVLKNDVTRRMYLRYTIPCATLNGVPFDTTFLVSAASSTTAPYLQSATIDLSGYSIDFTGILHDRVNTLTTQFTAQIDPTETLPVQINSADSVAAINTFHGIKPYYLRGYFGNQTIQIGPEETFFSVFHKVRSGSLGLDSLKMSLHLDNYVGMDARVTINSIWSRNSRTNNTVYLNHSLIGTPININRGVYTNSWPPVSPDSHLYVFDNANSNAKAMVENLPDELGYDVTLITDPMGNISLNNDFLYSAFGIDARLDVEMPLNFFADQLVIADTAAVDFSSVRNKENIESGTLTLRAQNEFPFEAQLQIYLTDINGNVTDSIVAVPGLIAAGATTTQNNYTVGIGYTSSELKIVLSQEQTQRLLNSTSVIMVAKFDTHTNPTYVKIFDSNRLDLQLSADFDYLIGN